MNASNHQMRRATLDDLVELRRLWQQAGFAAQDLEKRLTEFQIVETADGILLGSIGLKLEDQQGQIHSEAYRRPELAEELRPRLWERIQSVSRNHGLHRLWTLEKTAFWSSQAFQEADEHALCKLPRSFGEPRAGWLTLLLRAESVAGLSLEREFELFQQAQKETSERVLRQARALRILAVVIAVGCLLGAIWAMRYVLRHLPPAKR